MNIEEIRNRLTVLELKTDLTPAETENREQLKYLLATLDDATSAGKAPAGGAGEGKMFTEAYVTELRDEAKTKRLALRSKESELAIAQAKMSSFDEEDYKALQTERAEQLRVQEEAEIARKKEAGDYETLLSDSQAAATATLAAKSAEYDVKIAELSNRMATLDKENSNLYFVDQFNKATADAGLEIRDLLGVQLRLEREQAIVLDEEGRRGIVLKDAVGETMLDDSGKPLTLSGRLKQMHADEITSHMFASARQGAGSFTAPGASDTAPISNEIDYFVEGSGHFSVAEQARIYNEDPTRYDKYIAQVMSM
jgi:hypothetical protein